MLSVTDVPAQAVDSQADAGKGVSIAGQGGRRHAAWKPFITRRIFLLGTVLVLTACSGNFNGTVDGQGVPVLWTALYGQATDEGGQVLSVTAVSFLSDCERLGDWMEDGRDIRADAYQGERSQDDIDEAAERLRTNDATHGIPGDYWMAQVMYSGAVLDDGDEIDVGFDVDHILGVNFTHQREAPDYQEQLEDGDDGSTDRFGTDEGEAHFGIRGDTIDIEADDLELFDPSDDDADADPVGSGTLRLSAKECPALSAIVEEMLAIGPGASAIGD
ncbi:MAG: hypothetical protein IT383_15370 [Deltaproteobacteria bacterium]|nr:hypothetical protein [Deltaproteobacteria bacterium]